MLRNAGGAARDRARGVRFVLIVGLSLVPMASALAANPDSLITPPTQAPATAAPQVAPPTQPAAPATAAPQSAPTDQPAGMAPAAAPSPAPDTASVSVGADTTQPDGGWPRLVQTPTGGTIVLYQPQLLSWENRTRLVAMSAVSYTPKGSSKAQLGTIKLESPTSTSVEERMVNVQKIDITSMHFQSLEKAQTKEVLEEIRKSLPKDNVLIALDRVLAAEDTTHLGAKGVKINTGPPPIFYSEKPALLVQFDGEPILSRIENTSLQFAVNTNWDVFKDEKTKLYYLRNKDYWLQGMELKDWEPAKKLPEDFEKLANDDNWRDVKNNIPGKGISKGKMPVVFVTRVPAELIMLDGGPKYEKVEGTNLQWLKNTESDVFRYKVKKTDEFYVLLSGRWFKTKKLDTGPWTFATDKLPPDFAKTPRDHDRARVLSSVPGTEEASEAVLLALVPRTARVDAKAIKAPDVKYDGEPQFKAIEGTQVSYAENTGFDVLKSGDSYYLCFQGVWFASKTPTGPWAAATSIPAEIYAIPSDSPMQHVTYVTVVDDDPDYPTYGYTAGYMGITLAFGCAMWGTGYYYPPYSHYPGMGYPVYYPRPVAYGGGVAYNPWTGAYGGHQSAYGPYGGVSRGAAYNPSTGTYARGAKAYGPAGSGGYAQAYNPRTGNGVSTRQGQNPYGSWGSSTVKRGDDWARTQRVTDAQGNTKWKAQGSGGGSAAGYRGEQGSGFVGQKGDDIYAGKDGNVYRKTDSGWQQHDQGGGWSDVSRPSGGGSPSTQPAGGQRPGGGPSASTQPAGGQRPGGGPSASTQPAGGGPSASTRDLDHDAQARNRGSQRTSDYGSYQRSGGSSSGSRGSSSSGSRGGGSRGGGSRGGGGGRRR